jgi:hypothetical protein
MMETKASRGEAISTAISHVSGAVVSGLPSVATQQWQA